MKYDVVIIGCGVTGAAAAFVILTTTISSLIGIISPVFSQVFLDRLLTRQNPEWLTPFMLMFCALALISITVSWIAAVYSLRIQGKMASVGSASYLWKVLRLPMQFFSQRLSADISDRQATNASIAGTLIQTFAPLALNAAMMVFYLVVMIRYSWLLALIGVGAIFLNMAVSALISAKRINITRVQQRDDAKLSSATMSGIHMIETIKSAGAENGYFQRWAGYQASVNEARVRMSYINETLGSIPLMLGKLVDIAVPANEELNVFFSID